MTASIPRAYYMTMAAVAIVLVLLFASYWAPSSRTQSSRRSSLLEKKIGSDLEVMSRTSGVLTRKKAKLPSEVIDGIKKFVIFVGYERSGHSIVGSLMDAHPHVFITNEFFIFGKFDKLDNVTNGSWRDNLFQSLYNSSNSRPERLSSSSKGYTLNVEGLWAGTYVDHIEVIGDKSGGGTTKAYLINKQKFKQNFEKLKRNVQVPLRIIHVLRNPFDIISTNAIYTRDKSLLKYLKETGNKTSDPELLAKILYMFDEFRAVVEIIDDIFGRENVLDIHNCDLVADPRGTLTKIFNFLEVSTTEHYLDVCAEKVFKSVSWSRDLMEWPPELREMVEIMMKDYKMLSRYSFTSD